MTAQSFKGPPVPWGGVSNNGSESWDGRLQANSDFALAAVNSARMMYGHVLTSDGAAHTISSGGGGTLGFLPGPVTLTRSDSTLVIGLTQCDATSAIPGRAKSVANVIDFSTGVSKTQLGNSAHGIAATTWYDTAMDAGSLVVTPGDLLAFAVQLTAWTTTDTVTVRCGDSSLAGNLPGVTHLTGPSTYAAATAVPNMFIVFDDGAFGWIYGSSVFSVAATTLANFNSASAIKEYGNYFIFPFPISIIGCSSFGVTPSNDFSYVLYTDPLVTPAQQKIVAIDASILGSAVVSRRISGIFPTAYDLPANTPCAISFKPGASNIAGIYRTVANSNHQYTMNLGTDCYGVSRAAAAFSATTSGRDRFNLSLLASRLDDGAGGGSTKIPPFNGLIAAR